MSLKSRIRDISRDEAIKTVNGRSAITNPSAQTCNIIGQVTKTAIKDGIVTVSILLPDGTTIESSLTGTSKAIGPGSTVLVINGYILL